MGALPSSPAKARNRTVASECRGESNAGLGRVSFPSRANAEAPKPRVANAYQSSSWLAPPNRAMSAARIAFRASSIDGATGISTIAS